MRTGDVNGDGRSDLIFVRTKTTFLCCSQPPIGFVDVALALGTASGTFTFPAAQRISTEGHSGEYHFVQVADFDGDGRRDLGLVRFAPPDPPRIGSGFYGEVSALVSLSTGSGYAPAVKRTLTNLDDGTSWANLRVHAGDVDGDGRDDLVVVQQGSDCSSTTNLDRARAHTFVSRPGATFGADVRTSLTTVCGESFAGETLVDVNNDGRADLVGDRAFTVLGAICTDNDCDSDITIATNLGRGDGSFAPLVISTVWSGGGVGIGFFTGAFVDVNGDHLPDRVAVRAQNGTHWTLANYNLGNGQFATATTTKTTVGSGEPEFGCSILFGDVDGDGLLSVVKSCVQYFDWHLVTIAPATRFGGLLATATLPSGGSVGFDYTTSSSFVNGYLPLSFPVLGATRILDGRGQVATTSYSYTGGLYIPAERRFFGFATSRSMDPSGAIRDVAYTQHVADPDGTAASTHERTGAGALVRYTTTTFARTGNGTTAPFTSARTRRYEYECNGAATCKARSRGWTYAPYGAVASEIDYGDDAITGDERTTFHTQAVNATAFLTQLDATVTVRAGAGVVTGTQLAYTETAYDEAATAATPPTRGLVTARSRWRGGTAFAVERTHHDAAGNVIAKIDPLGATTTLAYDARHRLASTRNPLGHVEARTYDALGRLATITDANGGVTRHVYDTLGRLVRRTTPDGAVATAAFTNWGNPATQYVTTAIADGSADGLWKRTYLDGLLRPVRVVAEGGITTDTTYDGRDLVAARSAPYLTGATPAWTTTTYDAVARPLRVTEPDGAVVITAYGNWSVSTTNQRGLVTDRFYDAYQQLVQVVERAPTPQTTTITYDLLGNRVGITDAQGNTTTAVFDRLRRRTDAYDPDLGHWQYGYDDAGRVIQRIDARGIRIDSTYDALGRPLERRAGATVLAAFFYDEVAAGYANVGRMTHFTDPTGSTRRDYDPAGRLRTERKTIGGETYRVDWSFDAAGRAASIQYPAVGGVREQVAIGYDAAGRTQSVGAYVGGVGYDAWGNVTSATFGNAATVARTYSPARGWMVGQTVTVGGAVRDQFAVTRALSGDVLGRTSTVEARDAWLFSYDQLGRLTSANNTNDDMLDETFSYDAIGNRLSARRGATTALYTYPGAGAAHPHAPTTVGGQPVRYDANGNRRGIGSASDAVYDEMNRLVDDGTTTYAYDAEGTRVRAGTRVFLRDLLEIDGSASWRYYTLGNERVARRDAGGTVLYYHGDAIGSVRTLTSAAGTVVGTKRVFAFGELASSVGLEDPFGLAGQRLDPSGLYHMNARQMDPVRGQFTQPDPSDDPDPARPQSLNRYSYAYNNPTRIVDPTGLSPRRRRREIITLAQSGGGDAGDAGDPASSASDTTQRLRDRAQAHPSQWITVERPSGERVPRPRLFSPEYDAIRKEQTTGLWAHDSVTGRVYSDLDLNWLPTMRDPATGRMVKRPDAPPLDVNKWDDKSREDLIEFGRGLDPRPVAPIYLEGAGSGRFERLDPDGTVSSVDNPKGIAPGLYDMLWIYRDEELLY